VRAKASDTWLTFAIGWHECLGNAPHPVGRLVVEAQKKTGKAPGEQPIWVQDLLAWLETIQPQNLPAEGWVKRVEEVLAELPGQGLPDEFWPKVKTGSDAEKEEEAEPQPLSDKEEAEPQPLSDEDRARLQAELNEIKNIAHDWDKFSALKAVAAQLPASEPELLQAALEAAKDIEDAEYRSKALRALAAQLPASEPKLLQSALNAAKAIEKEEYRWQALGAVAAQLPASEPQLLQAALEAAKDIESEWDRSKALGAVATQLPASEPKLLQAALEAAKDIAYEAYRSKALGAVATQLPASEPKLLQAALEAAKDIEAEYLRWEALAALAAQLPASEPELLKAALEAAKAIEDEKYRWQALAALAAQLPASEPELLQAALEAAKAIKNGEYRWQALGAVAAQLPASESELLQAALEVAKTIKAEWYRWQALGAVAAQLPASEPKLLQAALEAAKAIKDGEYRWQALGAVAAQLPASERQPVLQAALEAAKDIKREGPMARALGALAAQLPASEPELLQAALEAAKDIKDEHYRSQALEAIAAQLPASEPKLLQAALEAAKDIAYEDYRSQALGALATQLPASEPELLQAALEAAKDIAYEDYRSQALGALATQLPASEPELLQAALEAAKDIEAEEYQSKALGALAAQLPASERQPVLQAALEAAKAIKDEEYRSKALGALAAQLPASEPELLQSALEAAKDIKSEEYRSQALGALAAQLPASEPELLQSALEAAKDIKSEEYRSQALGALAAQLPASEPELLQSALEAAKDIKDEEYRSQALGALAAQLPASEPELLQAALEAAKDIKREGYRWPALGALAAQLPASEPELLQAALEAAKDIEEEYYRSEALEAVAAQLPASEPELLQSALEAAKDIKSEEYRSQALGALAAQLPASEPELLQSALEAAKDIKDEEYRSQALGALAAQLPASEPELLQAALEAAKDIKREGYRWPALGALAAQLPASEPELLQAALEAAKDIEEEYYRSEALEAVAAQLPASEPELLQAALEAAKTIGDYSRSKVLAAVAAQLPASERQPVLQATLEAAKDIASEEYRWRALGALAAQLPASEPKLLQSALEAAKDIESEYYRSQALAAVAAQLPASEPKLLQSALEAAKDIESEYYRSQALGALAAQLPASERQPVLQAALEAARDIESEYSRSEALGALAAQLPASEPKLLQAALEVAKAIKGEVYRSAALAAVAAQLPASEPQLMQATLEAAKDIANEKHRSEALGAVAAQLPASEPQLMQAALNAAKDIEYEKYRSEALGAVAAQLPASEPELLQAALNAAKDIEYEKYRSEALGAVAARIPASEPQLLQQLMQIVLAIETPEHRITALSETACRITEALLLQVPQTLLATFLRIVPKGETTANKARLLGALAPKLSPGLFPSALQLIQTEISHPAYQAETLGNLAPYLPTDLLSEALDLIQHIPGYTYPTTALCALIPYLSLTQLQKALGLASERAPQPPLTSKIFQAIATRLSDANLSRPTPDDPAQKGHLIQHLLKYTQEHIDDERSIITILTALAPSLNSDHLDTISADILPKLPSEFYRAQVLAALATSPNLTAQHLESFCQAANDLSRPYPKATALSAFIPLFPNLHSAVVKLRDEAPSVTQSTDLALILATRPHPQTHNSPDQPQLIADQTKALRLIRNQSRNPDKANAIVKLGPHLHRDLLLEAQSIAQDIQDRYHQARSLLALATHFPEVRSTALTQIASLQDQDPIQHIELLSQYTITVPEQIPTLLKAIEDWAEKNPFKDDPTEPDPNNFKRRRVLIALKPHLPIRLDQEIDRETDIGKAPQNLWERALFVLRTEYRQALKTGSLRNDSTQDEDLLNLKDEINALTEMLLMRDLEPPVAVGILGGWGGGKTYIMHLMQTHMVQIRSQGLEPIEAWGLTEGRNTPDNDRVGRFVGHIYQIKFDAWTYAKGNLWASLMQTIFIQLDRQISLEQQLYKSFNDQGIEPDRPDSTSGEIWKVLYQSSEADQEYFLKQVSKGDTLKELDQSERDLIDKLIWNKRKIARQEAQEELTAYQADLTVLETKIKTKTDQIDQAQKNLETSQQEDTQQLVDQINQVFVVSEVLLKKRIGDDAFKNLHQQILSKLPKDFSVEDFQEFKGQLRELVANILEGKDNDDRPFSLTLSSLKQWSQKNLALIVIFLVFAIVSWQASWLPWDVLAKLIPEDFLSPLIVEGIVRLSPVLLFFQRLWKSGFRWYSQAKTALLECETQIERSRTVVDRETQRLQKHQEERITSLQTTLAQLLQQQQILAEKVKAAQAAVPQNVYASLQSYIAQRIQEGTYDRHLGLMHVVKEDLTKLSDRLLPPKQDSEAYKEQLEDLKKVFPRGPARVVVYIDDLDRCPPNTVVEVLEAVQLLVKNPLFIAVLAIDERYINRALAKQYKGVLSLQGRPSAADYLEKIIQIPYRIRPIAEDALRSYLRAQVVVQDSETSGSKFNEFSPQEFNLLIQCCQEAELSPRSLKRLTNIYKLYKILSRTRGHRPTRREQKAILTLLAFSSRYPDLMRDIIEDISSHYEEGRHLGTCV
jgi:predicted KAP-like P-loop ATPase